jgi:hypothetical protein
MRGEQIVQRVDNVGNLAGGSIESDLRRRFCTDSSLKDRLAGYQRHMGR